MKKKKKSVFPVFLSILLIGVLLGVAAFFILGRTHMPEREPAEKKEDGGVQLPSLFSAPPPELPAELTAIPAPAPDAVPQAETETGKALYAAAARCWQSEALGEAAVTGTEKSAEALLEQRFTYLDTEKLAPVLAEQLRETLQTRVTAATMKREIYAEDNTYLPALLEECYAQTLSALLEAPEGFCSQQTLRLQAAYPDGEEARWVLAEGSDRETLGAIYPAPDRDWDALAGALFTQVTAELPYLPLHYTIPENALCGPVPNEDNYGFSFDPAEISAMLERPEAKALIGDQELVWRPDLPLMPNTGVGYYLDETILCLIWQESEAGGIGTFSEIFIADGSQLRRKIAGDELWSAEFLTTTDYAQRANAVLAFGGDFYYHGRACGISIYQRQICRFEPNTCDTCYITTDGDMLFSYRGQFSEQAEVEQFMADNDVVFSLVFGPVLIDDGVDVTPDSYLWGEINDTYARSALGWLGRHHYLTMNINCGAPGSGYYYLATLRQAADAMVRRGCIKAYTMDGGQTATTVFHGQLINPVQFGWEKGISDIIYFATALPNEPEE